MTHLQQHHHFKLEFLIRWPVFEGWRAPNVRSNTIAERCLWFSVKACIIASLRGLKTWL